ncbi:reverse transcriptase domain-containing protein [Tanacetum coccineum]
MSNHEQPTPSHPKSDVRNTTGKNKQTPQDSVRTTSAVDLEEFCEKHYEKLLPIMADKYEYEKRKKEKLEEVKARLDFGDARKKSTRAQESAYSEKLFSRHFEEFNHLKAREVNIKKQQSSDQSELQKDNATECGVFLMMHMEIYNGEIAKNRVWGLQRRTRKKSVAGKGFIAIDMGFKNAGAAKHQAVAFRSG